MSIINPMAVFKRSEDGATKMHLNFTKLNELTGDKEIFDIPNIILDELKVKPSEYDDYYNGWRAMRSKVGEPKVEFFLQEDEYGAIYSCKVVKKPRELTIEEVEEELGYPVKIIK